MTEQLNLKVNETLHSKTPFMGDNSNASTQQSDTPKQFDDQYKRQFTFSELNNINFKQTLLFYLNRLDSTAISANEAKTIQNFIESGQLSRKPTDLKAIQNVLEELTTPLATQTIGISIEHQNQIKHFKAQLPKEMDDPSNLAQKIYKSLKETPECTWSTPKTRILTHS